MELIIKNGTLINAFGGFRVEVGIADGKIVCLAENIDLGDNILWMSAESLYFPVQSTRTRILQCCLAAPYHTAACGGTTTPRFWQEIGECVALGVPSFKVFMVYDFGVTDGIFFQVLQKAKEVGALIAVHAENNELVNMFTKKYLSEGNSGRK